MAFLQRTVDGNDMVTIPAESLNAILAAIRNLQERKGSTQKEIAHYVSTVHNIPQEVVKKKVSLQIG